MTLSGEIVDSKCYLGVMKPGEGLTHRACAIRCISGGIPPMLVSADAQGRPVYHLLTDAAGNALARELLPFVGRPVRISGSEERRNGALFLRTVMPPELL